MTDAAPGDGPVLIIGTERSGSNLLRLVLNAHSRVAVPHPPHFLRYLAPIADSYGNLEDDANLRSLVADAMLLLRVHPHPWGHPVDAEQVMREAGRSVFGVVAALYDQYRAAEGKARWGCKSTFTVDYVDEVLAERPDARFVMLVRDPRDVAASARRSVFCHYHPARTAALWARQQERGLAALDRHGAAVVHLLRYEDLVSTPDKEVERLCTFLGEPVEEAMFAHHTSPAARRTAALAESWRNAGAPITTTSVGAHRHRLTPAERAVVEQITGSAMSRLGYRVDPRHAPVVLPSALEVRLRDLGTRVLVEARSLRRDDNARQRLARDVAVAWLRARARLRSGARTHRTTRQDGRVRPMEDMP
ncbi:sulfotransferase [Umezawaea sp. Da 62-37]|uniref:sulfotransferase family protein n=1 Tax=Umezawaea sp. Da 62-37 TaxID=3075927 RepID=UPI0028F71F2E|nr:sulfotransferase [Umezawaea sp. Da 62-37]WNV84995.1 sulfotransferase [Umezawaea sp. Da 62-37]